MFWQRHKSTTHKKRNFAIAPLKLYLPLRDITYIYIVYYFLKAEIKFYTNLYKFKKNICVGVNNNNNKNIYHFIAPQTNVFRAMRTKDKLLSKKLHLTYYRARDRSLA